MKNFFLKTFSFVGLLLFATPVFAQGMMGSAFLSPSVPQDSALMQEEAQGLDIWQKMQRQEVVCSSLSNDQFELLGEYFMGQMMGSAHAGMNIRLKASLGETGEVQTHITLAKRLTGCDPSATYGAAYTGFMPMMGMMFANGTGWDGSYAYRSSMMQTMYSMYGVHGWSGWVIILLWWVLIIVAIATFVQWVLSLQTGHPGHGALEHLRIRYAKGEIDKKTFDRMKKEVK